MGGSICEICGRHCAETLCVRCGRVVCKQCFHVIENLCMECTPTKLFFTSSRGVSSAGLRMLGMLLIVVGLLVTSIALSPEAGVGEGVVVIFPFIFGYVSGLAAVALTIAFLGIFIATSLLPWFLVSRRGLGDDFSQARREYIPCESEALEYMITINLPRGLRKTVYIEGEGNELHLRSSVDKSFHRSYTLPAGFEVDEYNYEYDGSYLLLKLKLKRTV